MGLIEKGIAIVMLPLSVLIILEAIGIFYLGLPVDKALIGASLMIAFQVVALLFLKIEAGHIRPINYVTAIIFIVPAASYIINIYFPFVEDKIIPLILGIMMLCEGVYGMH